MALRRFNLSFERQQPDDQIIDLMIAAESLFLSDMGDKGELSYRLALRAAKFVESSRYKPREVFDLMRVAYGIRSKLVHGGSLNIIKLPNNPDAGLGELVTEMKEILRLAISKALSDSQVGQEGYWEDSFFDSFVESKPN